MANYDVDILTINKDGNTYTLDKTPLNTLFDGTGAASVKTETIDQKAKLQWNSTDESLDVVFL